jgi:hypothetical protein
MWIWGGTTPPNSFSRQGSTATAFFDTAPGSFERHRSNKPLLTPILLIRAVDPPDAGVVSVAVCGVQAMIQLRRRDARAVSKKRCVVPGFIRLIRLFPTDPL